MPEPATAIIASAGIGAGANIFSSNKAAKAQMGAVDKSIAAQQGMQERALQMFRGLFDEGKAEMMPYIDLGDDAAGQLGGRLGELTAPTMMDQETLEKTPGYKWLIEQGMRGVTGSNVLRGVSGAQFKGATDFMKGLADTTYKDQWNMARLNKEDAFNRLFKTADMGRTGAGAILNAAVSGGSSILGNSATVGKGIGDAYIGGGNADAARWLSMGQNVGNFANSIPAAMMANKLFPQAKGTSGMYGDPNSGANLGYGDYTY